VIPIGDNVRGGRVPWVTLGLLGLQAGWFAASWWAPEFGAYWRPVFELVAERVGGVWQRVWREGAFLPEVPGGFVWVAVAPLFGALFLHAGPVHLLVNLVFLWTLGDDLEGRLGKLRFVVFLCGCSVAASVLAVLLEPARTTPIADASGTMAGVLGGFGLLYPKARIKVLLPMMIGHLPLWPMALGWFALQWPPVRGLFSGDAAPWFGYPVLVGTLVVGLLLVAVLRIGTKPVGAPVYA
jgi:membrane associated rhomboid family serine protease